jgi:hypothetical protein
VPLVVREIGRVRVERCRDARIADVDAQALVANQLRADVHDNHVAVRIDRARAMLESAAGLIAGASIWNGLLLVRAMAADGLALQQAIAPLAEWLSGRPLPRVWQC